MAYLGREAAKAPLVTADIPDDSITSAKIVDATVAAGDLAANSVDSSELVDGSVDLSHMSSESVDEDNLHVSNSPTDGYVLTARSSAAGDMTWEAAGGIASTHNAVAKAWVTFNGSGTVAIIDDYYVSSITDNGVGLYTVNFDSVLANANYAVTMIGNNTVAKLNTGSFTTGSYQLVSYNISGYEDLSRVMSIVFGD